MEDGEKSITLQAYTDMIVKLTLAFLEIVRNRAFFYKEPPDYTGYCQELSCSIFPGIDKVLPQAEAYKFKRKITETNKRISIPQFFQELAMFCEPLIEKQQQEKRAKITRKKRPVK